MDLWYDRRNPPSKDPSEVEFAAWCSRLLIRCAEELASPTPPATRPESIDLELVTGIPCNALVQRCLYFARSDFLPLKMRKQALSLLQALLQLGDSKPLTVALGHNPVIRDSLAVLRLTATTQEPDASKKATLMTSLSDKMVSVWAHILHNGQLIGSDAMRRQSRQAVDSNMLAYLEEWIPTCQSELKRKMFHLGQIPPCSFYFFDPFTVATASENFDGSQGLDCVPRSPSSSLCRSGGPTIENKQGC